MNSNPEAATVTTILLSTTEERCRYATVYSTIMRIDNKYLKQ